MLIRHTLAAALALVAGAAHAQSANERVNGTVKSIHDGHLVVTSSQGDVDLVVTPDTKLLSRKPATTQDIKVGSYLGTANQTVPEGGRANEVHLLDNGPNVHSPMNKDGLMMTNGHVKAVHDTANGEEIDVDYGQGSRHVIVPANTPVSRLEANDISQLKVGAQVNIVSGATPDGKKTAQYISLVDAK